MTCIVKFLLLLGALVSIVEASSVDLKILTLNVFRRPEIGIGEGFYGKKRIERICDVLRDSSHPQNHGWDIVLIQEAWTINSRRHLRDCGYTHIMDFGDRKSSEENLDSGLMILSKFPLVKKDRLNFKQRGELSRVFEDGELLVKKSAYLSQVKIDGKNLLWVVNTHLISNYCDSEKKSNDCVSYERERSQQLGQLKSWLSKRVKSREHIILAGDLNMGPQKAASDKNWIHFSKFFPGFKQANYDFQTSTFSQENYFNSSDLGKLDHIFASSSLRIFNGKLAFNKKIELKGQILNYSDHYGWESTVQLPKI